LGLKPLNNESYLLNRVAQDDELAFEELFMGYHHQLGEYILMLTHSQELTEDIVQEVFLKVWMNREKLTEINNFSSYLFILTRNYTLNSLRRMLNHNKYQEYYKQQFDDMEPAEPPADNLNNNPDIQVLVDQAIARLPSQQQKVFLLRMQGLKNPEIADKMQISTDSVKKYQQWALKSVSCYVKSSNILYSVLLLMCYLEDF
jgi:RNA polymerase sigma-70 factor (family 1)